MNFLPSVVRSLGVRRLHPPTITSWNSLSQKVHNDFEYPDFSDDRNKSTRDPNSNTRKSDGVRRLTKTLPLAAGLMAGVYCGKTVVQELVLSMAASADVLAMAQIEVKLDTIAEGSMVTMKWRGKPLFIKHRTEEDIRIARETPMSELRHPERDEDRVIVPKWLVMIGVCTHLGCVPIGNAGDYNSYYCPCHGSHYDQSGRIRKGPAPTNLEVPEYAFLNDNTILVG